MERRTFLGGLAATVALGCGGSGVLSLNSAATMSRSMRLESGFFFGHDVRASNSITYVLDLSGSMSERTGTVVEQVGKDAAADVGGSMLRGVAGQSVGGAAANTVLNMDKKVELVKDHLSASLRGLPTGAEFNVVLFSNGVQKLAPGMVPASGVTTSLVSGFVSQLREGGSTSMKSAIAAGLDTEADDLMILTDGLPTDAAPEDILAMVSESVAQRPRRIFTVGVGDDQARDFLTRLAVDHGGEYLAYE